MSRTLLLLVAALLAALFCGDLLRHALPDRVPARAHDADTKGRLIVLGVDGLDFRFYEDYVGQGALPHLAALRQDGAAHVLMPELPPESPVSWASLLTGRTPAAHGLFDFIRPDHDYTPGNGMVAVRRARFLLGKVPFRGPQVASRVRAETFIQRVHAAGYPTLSLRQPMLFPAPNVPGARWWSGLGTPDVAGSAGYYTIYSSELGFPRGTTTFGGLRMPLTEGAVASRYTTSLPGPFDPTRARDERGGMRRASIPLVFERLDGGAGIRIRVGEHAVEVADGGRSPLLRVRFTMSTLPPIDVSGLVRFEVKSLEPLRVLTSPVQLDPRDTLLPITSPPEFAQQLQARYGDFETLGWQEETFPLNDRYQDDRGFLRDTLADMDRMAGILLGELEGDARLVFAVTTAVDRSCHAFWRYRDSDHPLHGERDTTLGDPLLTVMQRLDTLVGALRSRLAPEDTLLIVSDHGFETWRYAVNVNAWLQQQGYLVLNEDPDPKSFDNVFAGVRGRAAVDWSRTRAFSMGLGQIYINRTGRFRQGIVEADEAEALAKEIAGRLGTLRNPLWTGDSEPGGRFGPSVFTRIVYLPDVFQGPYAHELPDLQLCLAPGYRVSWQTALLGDMAVGTPLVEENRVPWSGDHCSTDPAGVPGVLLSNRAIPAAPAARPYHVRDIAATVLDYFGIDHEDLAGEAEPIPVSFPVPLPR